MRRLDQLLQWPRFPWLLAVVAALIALWSNWAIYRSFSWNRDEPVYLWQAELLRNGQMTAAAGPRPELFHPWLSGLHDGAFFTQYPLGWPIAILVGKLVGVPALTLAFAAALAVVGTYALARELTRDRRIAAIAGVLLLASPIVAVQGGAYLTYLFALGLGTLFATNLLAGVRLGSRWRLLAAGALLGWMVMTRNYDAVVWAVVVGGFVLGTEWRRWRELVRMAPPFLAGILPLVAFQLWHNAHLTGSPLEFPITVADPLDTFGFGYKRLMPGLAPYDYRPMAALRGTAKNAFFTPWFLVGSYLGAAIAALGVGVCAKARSTWLLVAMGVAFPLAYFPFWGTHVSSLTTRISGPIYSIPAYVPLCILMAQGLVWAAKRFPRTTAVAVVAMVAITIPVSIGRLGLNRHLSRMQLAWSESTEDLDGPAYVVVGSSQYLMQLNPGSSNGADRSGEIVFLTDGDPSIITELEANPERTPYLQRVLAPTNDLAPAEDTDEFDVEVVPIEIVQGEVLALTARLVLPVDGVAHVALQLDEDEAVAEVDVPGRAGEAVEVVWLLGAERELVGADGIVVPAGGATVLVTAGFGADGEQAAANPSVRSRVLAQSGPTMRALLPATTFRPDPAVDPDDNDGVIIWRDDVARQDLTVSVEPGT